MCTASNTRLLWRTESHPKRHIDRFSCSYVAHDRESLYTIQWAALFLPSKMPLRIAASGPHSTRGSFGQPESTTQRVSGSVESFLQDPRSWQIDHATPSVAIGRIFVAQRCGLIIVVLCVGLDLSAFDFYSHTAV